MKILLILLIILLSSCNKQNIAPMNSLIIHKPSQSESYFIQKASYNIKKEKHGYELTFRVDTKESKQNSNTPNVEVTIISKKLPLLQPKKSWKQQPAYIDSDELGHLSNFYQYTHEGFENFSVTIISIKEGSLVASLTGYISDNSDTQSPVQVAIKGEFTKEEETERSVW